MSKREQLKQIEDRIEACKGNYYCEKWFPIMNALRTNNPVPQLCPSCKENGIDWSLSKKSGAKRHIALVHPTELCHRPQEQEAKDFLSNLRKEAEAESEETEKAKKRKIDDVEGIDDVDWLGLIDSHNDLFSGDTSNTICTEEDDDDYSSSDDDAEEEADDEVEEGVEICQSDGDDVQIDDQQDDNFVPNDIYEEYFNDFNDYDEPEKISKQERKKCWDNVKNSKSLKYILDCLEFVDIYLPDIKIDILGEKIMKACEEYAKAPSFETTGIVKTDSDRVVVSSYLRKDYRIRQLKQLGYYIQPKMLPLLIPEKNENDEVELKPIGPTRFYSWVSLIDVCKLMLQNASLRLHLDNEKPSCAKPEIRKTILDSAQNKRVAGIFKIELSLDDAIVGPSNGIGAGKSQKYLFVYASFPDLPYEFRSKPDGIETIMIVKRSRLKLIPEDKKHHTFSFLFRKLRNEVSKLMTDGIAINGKVYQVTISTLTGDNLAINEFLGWCQSFNRFSFICRICGAPGICKHKKKKKTTKKQKTIDDNKQIIEEEGRQISSHDPSQSCNECKSIQEKDTETKLLTPLDLETEEGKQKYGLFRRFPLSGLKGINVCNISPLDPLHDLPEGILPRIEEILLLKIKNKIQSVCKKTKAQVQSIFTNCLSSTKFYEGAPTIRITDKKDEIKIDGKGIQKLELLFRMEEMFHSVIVGDKCFTFEELLGEDGVELYYAAKKFTLLTFSQELNNDDIAKLKKEAFNIISAVRKCFPKIASKQANKLTNKKTDNQANNQTKDNLNEPKETNSVNVWAKLHHLSHYWSMVELYGPPYLYATWHYEQKHQTAKFIARRMYNFNNLAYSISEKHQILHASALERMDYFNIDFFPSINTDRCVTFDLADYEKLVSLGTYYKLEEMLPGNRPFKLKSNVLYRLPNPRGTWLYVENFKIGGLSGGESFCEGKVFALKRIDRVKRPTLEIGGPMAELEIIKNSVLISSKNISTHQKDFLFEVYDSTIECKCPTLNAKPKKKASKKCPNKCNVKNFFLINWIHNK